MLKLRDCTFVLFEDEIPQNEEFCVQIDKIFTYRELRLPQVEEYLVRVEQFVVQIKGLYFLNIRSLKMREFLCQILPFALNLMKDDLLSVSSYIFCLNS